MTGSARLRITQLLGSLKAGDLAGQEALFAQIYGELHRLAERSLRPRDALPTLQATELVHEAYLRLCRGTAPEFRDRSHFYAVAAKVMRALLIDHARRTRSHKRTPRGERVLLEQVASQYSEDADLLELDQALQELGQQEPLLENLVELRFFVGLTMAEIAEHLGVPLRSAERKLQFARTWLRRWFAAREA